MVNRQKNQKYRKIPEITGKRVILRKTTTAHADKLYEQIKSLGVLENLTIDINNLNEFRRYILFIENQWQMNQDFTYTIFTKSNQVETGKLGNIRIPIGQISIYNISFTNYRGELGIWLGRSYWTQGIGTEALLLMIKYGFENLFLNRLQAHIFIENARSISLFERLGFKREGKIREYVCKKDKFKDVYSYSLLRGEY
ncbi:MAG: hypothetical protein DRO88_06090 [Promethearchaeia archaeon]|nr:MAG: hypothetical protein DRO88_06090 [Candidatus Lokiarchaeia archaeon]